MNVILSKRLPRLAACFALLALQSALNADSTPAAGPATTELKDHTLFMGADVLVQYANGLHRLRDIRNVSFVIAVDGKPTQLPMYGRNPVNLEVRNSLKVSTVSAAVTDLKTERAYTPLQDPDRKFQEQVDAGLGVAAANDMNGYLADQAARSNNIIKNDPYWVVGWFAPIAPASGAKVEAAVNEVNASNQLAASNAQMEFGIGNYGLQNAERQISRDQGLYDAMKVEFEMSSDHPLAHPFVIVIVQYREKDAKLNLQHNWIMAKALDAISARPQSIHFMQGGFPPGYELISSQFHLYNDGFEVATNVADERVAMTADEAFQYSVAEYVGNHRDGTAGALCADRNVPPDLAARLLARQRETAFVVKVSPLGRVLDIYGDDAHTKLDDEDLVRAIGYVHFFPALQKGKPVVGYVKAKLTDITHI